ncbi:MAG: FliM/FliN family flagellar motor switch protein, partial [Mariprofundaceae bacterium]|nr:FliM/FliN family flagellar motor switch protein [Mariprofundaceae bacterium]
MHLEKAWKPVSVLDFVLFKIDTDPQFLAVASSHEGCFSMHFEIQLDENVKGMFSLHYPRTFLEPMLDNLRSTISDEPAAVDKDWEERLEDSLNDVPITMRLEMGQCVMNVGQFLNLSPGDYLPFKVSESEPSILWIDRMPMFQTQAGSQDGMLAAELIHKIHGGAS